MLNSVWGKGDKRYPLTEPIPVPFSQFVPLTKGKGDGTLKRPQNPSWANQKGELFLTTDARESVVAAILTQNGTFTAAAIHHQTGLARQLIFKHLTKLTEKGLLEKHNQVYFALDKETLVQQLLETKQPRETGRFEPTNYWLSHSSLLGNKETTNLILMARALGLTDSAAMKSAMIEELDRAIKSLAREKKYLATGQRSTIMTAKQLRKGYFKTFKVNGKDQQFSFDETTFIKYLYDAMSSIMESFTLTLKDAEIELVRKLNENN